MLGILCGLKKKKEREISEAEYFNSVVEKIVRLKELWIICVARFRQRVHYKKDLIKFENLFFLFVNQ